jgi:hypothetical protein
MVVEKSRGWDDQRWGFRVRRQWDDLHPRGVGGKRGPEETAVGNRGVAQPYYIVSEVSRAWRERCCWFGNALRISHPQITLCWVRRSVRQKGKHWGLSEVWVERPREMALVTDGGRNNQGTLCLFVSSFFAVLGFELRASSMLGRHSTTWEMPAYLFFLRIWHFLARCQWLTPVILVTQEAEIRRISVWSHPGQIVPRDPVLKKPSQKRAGGWLKVKALSSNPNTSKKRKRKKNMQFLCF